jgi:hypothetical protein
MFINYLILNLILILIVVDTRSLILCIQGRCSVSLHPPVWVMCAANEVWLNVR